MTQLVEIFCSLPFLQEDSQGKVIISWLPDRQLRRHLNQILQQNPQVNEAELVKYFLKCLLKSAHDSLAKGHLIAFLSRFAQESARRVQQELETIRGISSELSFLTKDFLQMAFEAVLEPQNFLQKFEVNYSQNSLWYPAFKKYIRQKLDGIICDKLREYQGMTTFKRSDLGLASRSSAKRVKEALKFRGEIEPRLSQYLLAWHCFQELRKAQIINIQKSQQQEFNLIAERYNQLRHKLPLDWGINLEIQGKIIEVWLRDIGAAIRTYLDRPTNSLDAPVYQDSGTTKTWEEMIPDPATIEVDDILFKQDLEAELFQFKRFLDDLLAQLESASHQIPLLKHGLTLVQKQIEQELDRNQSTISRQYQKFLSQLLKQIGEWAKNKQKIVINSETLNNLKSYLQEHLDDYYSELLVQFWLETWQQLLYNYQQPLVLYYVHQRDYATISQELNIAEPTEIMSLLEAARNSYQEAVVERIETYLQLTFKPNGIARERIVILTEQQLLNLVP